jgi:HIV Tat-specific factor 1
MCKHLPMSVRSSVPQPATFEADPRIYYSKTAETWRIEDDDGTELEYDAAKASWVPVVCAS